MGNYQRDDVWNMKHMQMFCSFLNFFPFSSFSFTGSFVHYKVSECSTLNETVLSFHLNLFLRNCKYSGHQTPELHLHVLGILCWCRKSVLDFFAVHKCDQDLRIKKSIYFLHYKLETQVLEHHDPSSRVLSSMT